MSGGNDNEMLKVISGSAVLKVKNSRDEMKEFRVISGKKLWLDRNIGVRIETINKSDEEWLSWARTYEFFAPI